MHFILHKLALIPSIMSDAMGCHAQRNAARPHARAYARNSTKKCITPEGLLSLKRTARLHAETHIEYTKTLLYVTSHICGDKLNVHQRLYFSKVDAYSFSLPQVLRTSEVGDLRGKSVAFRRRDAQLSA